MNQSAHFGPIKKPKVRLPHEKVLEPFRRGHQLRFIHCLYTRRCGRIPPVSSRGVAHHHLAIRRHRHYLHRLLGQAECVRRHRWTRDLLPLVGNDRELWGNRCTARLWRRSPPLVRGPHEVIRQLGESLSSLIDTAFRPTTPRGSHPAAFFISKSTYMSITKMYFYLL